MFIHSILDLIVEVLIYINKYLMSSELYQSIIYLNSQEVLIQESAVIIYYHQIVIGFTLRFYKILICIISITEINFNKIITILIIRMCKRNVRHSILDRNTFQSNTSPSTEIISVIQ